MVLNADALVMRLIVRSAVVLAAWLFPFVAGLFALEGLPESIGRTLLMQSLVVTWACGVFVIGALSAKSSHARIHNSPLQSQYVREVSPVVDRWLLRIGSLAGISMCVLAASTWIWDVPTEAGGVPILMSWMLLAAVLPVDSGALTVNRRDAQLIGAFAPWAFVLAFPSYMQTRAGCGNRKSAALAVASMLALICGYVVFLLRTQP